MTTWQRWIVGPLAAIAVLLAAASFAASLPDDMFPQTLLRFLSSGYERNAPTWFNVGLLFLVAFAAMLACALAYRDPQVHRGTRRWWLAVIAVLLAFSFDEATSVHETVGRVLRPVIQSSLDGRGGPLGRTTWLLPGIIVGAALLLGLVLGWRSAPERVRWGLIIGFGVLLLGAVGFEVLGSLAITAAGGERTLVYWFLSAIEELLEMLGAIVMIGAVLRAIAVAPDGPSLRLTYIGSEPVRPEPGAG